MAMIDAEGLTIADLEAMPDDGRRYDVAEPIAISCRMSDLFDSPE